MSEESSARTVGRVAALWRYPVKSMGAEPLTEADVAWHGVAGDRRWAFIRNDDRRSTIARLGEIVGQSLAVADERQGCLGVYGSTVEPGRIAVGDTVSI